MIPAIISVHATNRAKIFVNDTGIIWKPRTEIANAFGSAIL